MLLSSVRWTLAVLVLVTVGVTIAGCGGTTGPAEPGTDCDWVVGSGTSGADGLVTIDMGQLGTFRAKVRDGLTTEPVAGAQYICVASACSDEASWIVMGGDGYQVGLYTYTRGDVITNQGTVPTIWDELFPWTGGDNPMPGIHGIAWVPEDTWVEIRSSVTELATDQIVNTDGGLIADELATRVSGLVLATTYPPDSNSVLVHICWADHSSPGDVLEELKDGVYLAQGYCETQEVKLAEMDGPNTGRTMLDIALIEPVVTAPGCVSITNLGSVEGTVRDATTGASISGATVAVNGVQTTSGGAGGYSVTDVAPGDHVLVTASASGYQPFSMVLVVGDSETVQQDVVLVPSALSADQYRFILTWGQDPQDLDSHLWVPTGVEQHVHVCFWSRGTLSAEPYAELDVDDMFSFGPETVTLLPEYEGQYVYAVHEWTGTGTLATSNAVVEIYAGNNLIRVLDVPTGTCGENYWWYVGQLNAKTGEFALINEFMATSPLPEWRPAHVTKSVTERYAGEHTGKQKNLIAATRAGPPRSRARPWRPAPVPRGV
ncbi:MAG: carboxypeptidase regulatory-like domain-containing protein [Candidatus Eisenbacteria sp.]|nr:carboxypeptidase regulatory-like domain-containing protein [Candidatus Eisenbacteria bacterium]